IAYRASRAELVKGAFEVVEADEGFLSVIRTHGGSRLFTAFNLSGLPREVVLPAGAWTADHDAPFDSDDGTILRPWQATFKAAI
ncbi:MAG: alpha-glucosidase, partial [Boseongicola sp.]|nr:alpha-glucosidase [Boseongicola sp.]